VAFISGTPADIRIYKSYVFITFHQYVCRECEKNANVIKYFITGLNRKQHLVEINFLCVHKKLRSKRLAPVLIKEITRRSHLQGIFQAVYTAGIVLPKPICSAR